MTKCTAFASLVFLITIFVSCTGSQSEKTPNDTVPPIISVTPPGTDVQSVFDSHTLHFSLSATDANNNALTVSCSSNCPSTMTISMSGQVSWRPMPKDIGSHDVVFKATDGYGVMTTKTIHLTVENQFSTNKPAFMVIGQPSFTARSANRGSPTPVADGLNGPWGVFANPSTLVVNDNVNHRTVIYKPFPKTPDATPTFVLGQQNFTSNVSFPVSVDGPHCNEKSVDGAGGLAFTGDYLIVGHQGPYFGRALAFPGIPDESYPAGTFALGHSNLTYCKTEPVDAYSLKANYGLGVFATNDQIVLADRGYHRVTIFNRPFSLGMNASLVVGQSVFNTSASGAGTSGLNGPMGTWTDGSTYLVVADSANNRVLVFSPFPSSNGPAASVVIGQTNFGNVSPNKAGSASCSTLSNPTSVFYDGYRLFVSDSGNNRILVFNGMPTANNPEAAIVLGQPDCTSAAPNQGGAAASASALSLGTGGIFFEGTSLIVADQLNHRVLYFGSGFDD